MAILNKAGDAVWPPKAEAGGGGSKLTTVECLAGEHPKRRPSSPLHSLRELLHDRLEQLADDGGPAVELMRVKNCLAELEMRFNATRRP